MSHSKGKSLAHTLKVFLIALLKFAGIAVAFACKLVAFILEMIAEGLGKLCGNGGSH